MEPFTTILLLVLMVGAFYLLLVRPQQKRAKAQRDTLSTLEPGTRVLLANGFYATVVSLGDTTVEVELAAGVTSHVVKQAVAQVVAPEADPLTPAAAVPGQLAHDDQAVAAEPVVGEQPSPYDRPGPAHQPGPYDEPTAIDEPGSESDPAAGRRHES